MPPQHGKSWLISKYFPVWYLGRHPDDRVILASYEADFAASWGSAAKTIFENWADKIFGLHVKHDSKSKKHWDIEGHEGGMDTAGAGGSQTGKRANFLDIDDPHKNPQEARSPIFQERIEDWYLGAADTRLPKDGLMNLTQTRWDELDLGGRILENEDHITAEEAFEILKNGGRIPRDTWVVLKFPAIATEHDILGRKPGEALCPDLFPIDVLKGKKKRMDARDPGMFEALYQQDPVSIEGSMFKKDYFHKVDSLPPVPLRKADLRWWDLADIYVPEDVPIEKRGAATAGVRLILTKDLKLYVADVKEFWKEDDEVMKEIKTTAQSDGYNVEIRTPQDPAQAGKSQVSIYSKLLRGYAYDGVIEHGDKEARAKPVALWGKLNGIYILRATWNTRFLYVCTRFPRGRHKDIIDAMSGSFSEIMPEQEEDEEIEIIPGLF